MAQTRTLHALIVEDEPHTAQFYRDMIEAGPLAGRVDLTMTDSAERAIELMRGQAPDVVLLDWSLSGGKGLDVLNEIRSDPKLRGTIVMVISGQPSRQTEVEAMQNGADDFLPKPFFLDVLEARFLNRLRRLDLV